MENEKIDYTTVNNLMTNVAAHLVKAGYRDEAYAMIALTKIISYRIEPKYLIPEFDSDAMTQYNRCIDTLDYFLNDESKLELKLGESIT